MNKLLAILALLLCCNLAQAQESNNGKKLWAKSFLNQPAPKIAVEQWITDQPDTQGKFVLVDFWATWCGPCRKAIPELNEFQKQFKDNLVVIGISDESVDKVKAMKTPVIEYSHGVAPKSAIKDVFEVTGIPHVVLIDPQGIVRWEGFPLLGGHELTADVIKTLIEKYK